MKRAAPSLLAALLISTTVPAKASFDQYSQELFKKGETVDSDHLVREPLLQMLNANCSVDTALKAGLTNDPTGFATALGGAEETLRSVAARLTPLAGQGRFGKLFRRKGIPVLTLMSGKTFPIRNGDELLAALAATALDSADAIKRIKDGKGGDDDFSIVVIDASIMSELILDFYSLA